MAETKEIVVLASSIRDNNLCVAGKELISKGETYDVGPWVRLSEKATKGGAVNPNTAKITGHGKVRPLDVIKVVVEANCKNPDHPEDWWLKPGEPWAFVSTYKHDILPKLVDPITALWNDGSGCKAVYAGHVPKMGKAASTLALVKAPQNWKFEYWKEIKPGYDGGPPKEKFHRDLQFKFGPHYHEFSVTDPEFMERHNVWKKMVQNSPQQVTVAKPDEVFFCLSLGLEFYGKHYKIAATIFES
jgi:hypothetical protein